MVASFLIAAVSAGVFGAAGEWMAAPVSEVAVGGEIGRRITSTVENNLLVADLEGAFLEPFLKRDEESGYIGLGKTIDACARLAAHTGNEKLIARKKEIVSKLLASQEADGYIGLMRPGARVRKLWDVHEMSYIVLGLTSDYALCGEQASLAGARKLADFLVARLTAEPPVKIEPDDLNPIMGTTGLDESMLYLTAVTGDTKYRDFVTGPRALAAWRKPLTLGRWGMIDGHAYAYTCKCMEQVRLSSDTPDAHLWEQTRGLFRFLLDEEGLVISGADGDHECWHNTQSGTTNLGETCAVAYLVRLCDEVLRRTGNPLFGDIMERTIYNALFGAQSPDGRRIRYYTPFEAPRSFHDTDTYCCPCNYRRIVAELPAMIAYATPGGVFVNLYTDSTVKLPLDAAGGVTLRQKTDYPNTGRVKLEVGPKKEAAFTIAFRKPGWCAEAAVRVNGEPVTPASPRPGVLAVERTWKSGDVVELEYPMAWRLIRGHQAQAGRAALMRGPQIFAYNPERNTGVKGGADPRLFTLDPDSVVKLGEPAGDDSVRPGGMACRVRVWEAGEWYPAAKTTEITLTEFADPGVTGTYFLMPNPNDERLVEDELRGKGAGCLD